MTKKGILEKLGLVELVEEKTPTPEVPVIKEEEVTPVVPVVEEKIKTETVAEKPMIDIVETSTNDIGEKLDVLIESYEKNKFLSIEEIYRTKNLDKDIKQTVFIAEVFMKALPENLPIDIKKKSTHNILDASGLKKDELLNDAYIRIDALNTVLEETVAKTAEMKEKNEKSIRELEDRIEMLKRNIEDRSEFEEKQSTTIEYEIQRIINIVDGIK